MKLHPSIVSLQPDVVGELVFPALELGLDAADRGLFLHAVPVPFRREHRVGLWRRGGSGECFVGDTSVPHLTQDSH